MKLSISVPEDDVAFLDRYAARQGIRSRSAAVQKAIQLLQASELGSAYEDAWSDWATNGDGEAWDATSGDGVTDATR